MLYFILCLKLLLNEVYFCLCLFRYVLLVSGLTVGNASAAFPLQVLIDMIKGDLGEEKDLKKFSRLVRVIIAGNSINHDEAELFKVRVLIVYLLTFYYLHKLHL